MSTNAPRGPAPRTAAVINPRAANGRAAAHWPRIVEQIGLVEALFTQHPHHAAELATQLLDEGFERILAVGGDGTISETMNGFFRDGRPINPEAEFGILPMGTGGDFQRSLAIPSIEAAVGVILSGKSRTIDAAHITYEAHTGGQTSRYFLNLTSFGMGGEVATRAKNSLSAYSGKLAFMYATVEVFFRYHAKTVELSLDGGAPTTHKILNIAIGNGRYHGGGMHVCPKALLDDGTLEVTIIEDLGMFTLAKDLPVLYSENIYKHPRVHHHRAAHVRATSREKVSIEVDGEAVGTLPIEVRLLPHAIKILTP
ncbi:MAG: diacylglycerol kinase family lipid kinase [Bryobacterales bacterium]|nr:diacylglycerol kinase family lipid kinase [Bryobacterales bacterium]